MGRKKLNNKPKVAEKTKFEGTKSIHDEPFKCSLEKLSSSYPKSAKTELTYDNLFREIVPKLTNYETMKWREIKENPSNHKINTTKQNSIPLIESLSKKIEENYIKKDDLKSVVNTLFSLRIDGKKRLFGYVHDNIFYALWYDAHHEILKVDKRNT